MNDDHARPWLPPLSSIGLVLLVCALVYFPQLGAGGLTMSEGHRVVPAWEMLDTREWLVPHMFGQPYLRKPPGMPWAIALSSELLGRTEFAARLVSALCATAMAFVALIWSRRCFGARAGLAAGLAQALMPQMWMWGRTAEIEVLNALGAQLLIFGVLETMRTRRTGWALVGSTGIVVAALAKGPAALPCLIAALSAGAMLLGWRSLLGNVRLWGSIALAGLIVAGVFSAIAARLAGLPAAAVTQSVSSFMWEPDRIAGILLLPLAAWVSGLPASLAFLFPWGRGAHDERARGSTLDSARLVAWTWVICVAIYTLAGVSNPRYALPAACLFPPLVGHVISGLEAWLNQARQRVALTMLLGHRVIWILLLVAGAGTFIFTLEARTRATSGRAAGIALAEALVERWKTDPQLSQKSPVLAIANGLVEARPEVLAYAEQGARSRGLPLHVRWTPAGIEAPDASTSLVLARTDDLSDEAAVVPRGLDVLGPWPVHKYRFVCVVLPPTR